MKQASPASGVKPLISVVVPMLNEADNIKHFYQALTKTIKPTKYTYELLFIDDGSTDSTRQVVAELKNSKQLRVELIQLSRNFGKEIATTAGLHAAKGEAALILDADLQHPINKIPDFIAKWEEGNDVVIGVRSQSAHSGSIKRLGSVFFYKIMNRIGDIDLIPHSTDYRMIDRQVIDAFNAFTEKDRITRGLIDWLGFERTVIPFVPEERQHGAPSYTVRRLMKLAMLSFTGHSLMPLRLAGYLGIVFMLFFGALGIAVYVENYIFNDPLGLAVSGTAMLGILLLFAIGIVLSSLGLMSLYIATIHGEVTNRPLYIVKRDRKV